VQILLGWDRPVYGKIAALQLLNMKENIEKTAPSAAHTEAYGQYVPKVLSCLNAALGVETEREGKKAIKSVISAVDLSIYLRRIFTVCHS
jgi:hypothetical protein